MKEASVSEDWSVEMDDLKHEETSDDHQEASGDDDLGFLHGMNLTNLVREFEMEAATGNGSQHLVLLSLADDNAEGAFPELPEEEDPNEEEEAQSEKEEEEKGTTEKQLEMS